MIHLLGLVFSLSIASASPPVCNVKLSGTAFTKSGKPSLIAMGREGLRVFTALGYRPQKSSKSLIFANTCPKQKSEAPTTFGGAGFPSLLVAENSCEKNFAKELGLTVQEIDNYGSMDSGGTLSVKSLLACADGTKLVSCAQVGGAESNNLGEICPDIFRGGN